MTRHRGCIVLRGTPASTRERATELLSGLPAADVLLVSQTDPGATRSQAVRGLLGRAFDAVVLDLHRGLDPELLGQAHGFVWGGGRLVLRMPPQGALPLEMRAPLAVFPFDAQAVGMRLWARLEQHLAAGEAVVPAEPVAPAPHAVHGTREQVRVVDALAALFASPEPALAALLSDRGRGKSSALGLALQQALARGPLRIAVSAESEAATREIFRFAPPHAARFVPAAELALLADELDVVIVDEAAQLPVPLLKRIARRHARARLAFATTARGYEGTGRGFVLRFLEWARAEPRPFSLFELQQPIRWDPGDPLEKQVLDVLALDAEPAPVEAVRDATVASCEHRVLSPESLAADERLLRDFFGLLVHAHYRTTPGDLHRVLDAPNLVRHALLHQGRVVAATLAALEGGLPRERCLALARGEERIRGHALPDTLISHAGRADAGELEMVRSIRIAVHPELRRRGLASALVEAIHRTHAPDLFGTIFGATPELLAFRRSVGYELARVGVSRGSRSGEPAAVMLRPVSARAQALMDDLRLELARALPAQLQLLDAEGQPGLEPELSHALRAGLPEPAPPGAADVRDAVARYLAGPVPMDGFAWALGPWVSSHAEALARLEPRARALIEARVLHRRAWREVAERAGLESLPAAMRALRPALRALAEQVDPALLV